jgi:hypothetical protein
VNPEANKKKVSRKKNLVIALIVIYVLMFVQPELIYATESSLNA